MSSVKPLNYKLLFEPNFKDFTFEGEELITAEVSGSIGTLSLDCAEIHVKGCRVFSGGREVGCSFMVDAKNESLVMNLVRRVSGKIQISVDFVGTLNDRLIGFYRSTYTDPNGKEKHMATTQFEAADARRAFPCWDRPDAKATFDVSMIIDSDMDAISNMPAIKTRKVGKRKMVIFDTTPVMSTYLLYMGVGEFDRIESRYKNVRVGVVTTRGNRKRAKFALYMTKKLLGYYENYFGIRYPLPKLDMIAVPDFASGAMENWGAITFRETALLYDPKNSSTSTKQNIAEIISHELAHQWFGNLVTMKWWNDLWLNESFATFMATKAVHHFYPDWDLWNQFVLSSVNEAMGLDALKSSHPIEVNVKSPSQVREIFDDISYDKGGSVLRMLEDYIGESNFRKGLRRYLTKHKYGNAVTDDLWDSLASVSNKPVRKMMDTWVRRVGYPLIKVERRGGHLNLSQSRFLLDGSGERKSWMVPVSVSFDGKRVSSLADGSVKIRIPKSARWFKVNVGQRGFYRVRYDMADLDKLRSLVSRRRLPDIDRWGIQNDMFALVVSGHMKIEDYLYFVRSYFGEDSYLVSMDIADGLNTFFLLFHGEKFHDKIVKYNKEYFRSLFIRLGWEPKRGERHTDALLRSYVISSLGRLDDYEILQGAKDRFERYLKNPNSLSPDLRSVVFNLVAWQGNDRTYNRLVSLYRKSKVQEERIRFLAALASFGNTRLLKKTLEFTLSDDVRTQDIYLPIARVAGNPYGKKIIWPWLKENWKEIAGRFGNMGNPLINRIISCVSVIADSNRTAEVSNFFSRNHVSGTEMKVAQTVERMRINSRLVMRARESLE